MFSISTEDACVQPLNVYKPRHRLLRVRHRSLHRSLKALSLVMDDRRPFYRFHSGEGDPDPVYPPGPIHPFDMYGRRSSLSTTLVTVEEGVQLVDSEFDYAVRNCKYHPLEPMRILVDAVERAPDREIIATWPEDLCWIQDGQVVGAPAHPIESQCITVLQFMTRGAIDCWFAERALADVENLYRDVPAVRFIQVHSGKYYAERRLRDGDQVPGSRNALESLMNSLEREGNRRIIAVDTASLDFFKSVGAIGWPFYVMLGPSGVVISKWYHGSTMGCLSSDDSSATVVLLDVTLCGAMSYYGDRLQSVLREDQYTMLPDGTLFDPPQRALPNLSGSVKEATWLSVDGSDSLPSGEPLAYPSKAIVVRRRLSAERLAEDWTPHQVDASSDQIFLVVVDTLHNRVVWRRMCTGQDAPVEETCQLGTLIGLSRPRGLCYDAEHDWVYVADTGNHRICRFRIPISTTNPVHSEVICEHLVGTGTARADLFGTLPATEQTLSAPWDVAMAQFQRKSTSGSKRDRVVYITCAGTNQVWQLEFYATNQKPGLEPVPRTCRPVCGSGDHRQLDIGTEENIEHRIEPIRALNFVASLAKPAGIDTISEKPHQTTSANNTYRELVYVADADSNSIRVFDPQERTTQLVCGGGTANGDIDDLFDYGDADGASRNSRFQHPLSLAIDAMRNAIYVADTYNGKIRRVDRDTGHVTTIHLVEATGAEIEASTALAMPNRLLHEPSGVSVDPGGYDGSGALIICETNAHHVYQVEWIDREDPTELPEPASSDAAVSVHTKGYVGLLHRLW